MSAILVVNSGSSSVKFQVFDVSHDGRPVRLIKGRVDGVGSRPRLVATGRDGVILVDQALEPGDVPDVPSALETASRWLRQRDIVPVAIGHRIVHGGPRYEGPVVVDAKVLGELYAYAPLAPLHQANNLAPIEYVLKHSPSLPQVACFDTAFHRTQSEVTRRYALPERLYQEGVQRYGFHGLSYEYIAGRLPDVAPEIASGKVIVAHLGSGASMCAIERGVSVESTMGFTALDGLPMGTRPGQIDPGVILYLLDRKGMSSAQAMDFLYKECGLKGLSGISSDVRDLLQSDNANARLALDYFVHRASLMIGLLCAALQGIDGLVFTAGIGENSPLMRARIVDQLGWLAARIDAVANESGRMLVSSEESWVPIYVIPTDEEMMIARHTLATLRKGIGNEQRQQAVG